MNRALIGVIALGVAACAVPAYAQSETASAMKNRLSIGLGQGTADGYAPTSVGTGTYLAPTTSPETNVNAEYWRSLSPDYALAISGAYGFSSMNWKGATSADPEIDATGTSLKFRLGVDKVGNVGDRLQFFLGPGVEYWSGEQKLDVGGSETESESVTRFGVSGRIGGFMMLSETVGIMGQVGHTFGVAKVDDSGAETSWWPNSFQASWGLAFGF
ncbi:MAG TPA: outer membrane beta-barrel protein [Candidatus Eisenbacteria bacterium]|nr:outer membrane beta-barrel protein [Candidatus Eisenbacteria bacterium]